MLFYVNIKTHETMFHLVHSSLFTFFLPVYTKMLLCSGTIYIQLSFIHETSLLCFVYFMYLTYILYNKFEHKNGNPEVFISNMSTVLTSKDNEYNYTINIIQII